jgi:hypothetical protein
VVEDRSSSSWISDENAALVLDRAAKLDAARARGLPVEQLREAALEAGISREAFERALAEVEELAAAAVSLPPPELEQSHLSQVDRSGWPVWSRRVTLLGGGFLLGALALLSSRVVGFGGVGVVFTLLIALQVALASAFKHREDRGITDFWLDLGFLWVGLTTLLMTSASPDRVLTIMATLGTLTGMAGTAVIAFADKDGPLALPDRT